MFTGMIVALITPFTKSGEIDFEALREHVSWMVEEKVDGIAVCGTTGEAPTMSEQEQIDVLNETLSIAKGRVPVIMGTGFNDTRKTFEMTVKAKEAGADGCLLIVPYYNRPTQEGCIEHFKEVAKAGLPMIVYTHPVRTGITLHVKTLAQIAEIPNVAAIKEGNADVELTMELARITSKPILSGVDGMTIPLMAGGGKGVISVLGNIIPSQWTQFVAHISAEEYQAARAIFDRYFHLCNAMFLETNPQCIKYALSLMGKCSPHLRLPMMEPREETKKQIREAMSRVNLILSDPVLKMIHV